MHGGNIVNLYRVVAIAVGRKDRIEHPFGNRLVLRWMRRNPGLPCWLIQRVTALLQRHEHRHQLHARPSPGLAEPSPGNRLRQREVRRLMTDVAIVVLARDAVEPSPFGGHPHMEMHGRKHRSHGGKCMLLDIVATPSKPFDFFFGHP